MRDLIVIGGGAAGLWASGTAAGRGLDVLVLEKNRKAGVKILMSGGTRCNITHACEIKGIVEAYGKKQGRFLKPSLYQLDPSAVVSTFNELGVATKVEATGKVFPVSDRALDVRDALVRRLTDAGASLKTGVAVEGVAYSQADACWKITVQGECLETRQVLLCCGGLSYAGCGTTGDGYAWARQAGHSLIETRPALTPLLSPATWVHQLSGITLPDVAVRIGLKQGKIKDPRNFCRGGFLWTHFGCSGPAPMNVSRFVSDLERPQDAHVQLDLLPDLTELEVEKAFDGSKTGSRTVISLLNDWLPRKLSQALLTKCSTPEDRPLAELPRKARLGLIESIKRLQVPLAGTRGYPKAEVTAGGISTSEVDPQTMESRVAPGLYLAGEILDLDGPIGGYNFQAAFSTGHTAALHMSKSD